jgi:nucleoside-diphosphate-sugar epimerase
VAAAVALAATDARAAGRVYNVAEPTAATEAEWVARIAGVVGWPGQVVAVPRGRLPVPFNTDQDLTVDSARIRAELGYREVADPDTALQRTVAWERANPPPQPVDCTAEDALIAERGL